ncbi:hypothetical protein [Bradyrhizobium sp. JR3.5]
MVKPPKPLNFEQSATPGCADLLEVVLFAPQGANEHDFLLGADVRFGTMMISSDDWSKSVEIGLSRATLGLGLRGCEIDPQVHRLGDKTPTGSKTRRENVQTVQTIKQTGSGFGGRLSASSSGSLSGKADAHVSGGATRDSKIQSTSKQAVEIHEQPVVAMSGNKWRFSAVGEDFMQSRYSGSEALCKLKVTAPSIAVEAQLSFHPKDLAIIDVETTSQSLLDNWKRSPNKTAIAKVSHR